MIDWKAILAQLVARLLPSLIDMIVEWIKGASDEEIAKAVREVGVKIQEIA